MPRTAPEIPKAIADAADFVLNQEMLPRDAQDLFRYAVLSRGVSRYGSQIEAAKKFGMQRQQLSQLLIALEGRL